MDTKEIIAGILGGISLLMMGFLAYGGIVSPEVVSHVLSSVLSGVVFYLFGSKLGEARATARIISLRKEDRLPQSLRETK